MPAPKYEREIRSLLDRLDDFLPEDQSRPTPIRRRPTFEQRRRQLANGLGRLVRYPILTAAFLIIVARFLILPIPGIGRTAALVVGLIACACIALLFAQLIRRVVRREPYERRWRGRVIEPDHGRVYQAMVRWWRRQSRRRN